MFNMFGKKKQESFGSKNMEEYTPAFLPKLPCPHTWHHHK